jgi:protein arginine kinase
MLASEEVLYLLSHLRMGVNLGRVKDVEMKIINELFIMTQQAHLQRRLGKKLESDARRVERASFVRSVLKA